MPMSNALERLYVKVTVQSDIVSEKIRKTINFQDCALRFVRTEVSVPFR